MDDAERTELYRLRRAMATLRAYLMQKRGMWANRAKDWPKSVDPRNTAKNLVSAYDVLLEMIEE